MLAFSNGNCLLAHRWLPHIASTNCSLFRRDFSAIPLPRRVARNRSCHRRVRGHALLEAPAARNVLVVLAKPEEDLGTTRERSTGRSHVCQEEQDRPIRSWMFPGQLRGGAGADERWWIGMTVPTAFCTNRRCWGVQRRITTRIELLSAILADTTDEVVLNRLPS